MTAFDSCSDTTLIHKELIDGGKVNVVSTQNNSNIKGIGGTAKGKVVELHLTNRDKDKDKDRYDSRIRDSDEDVKRYKGYENISRDNFQQVTGGKIQLLLGLDAGMDFFPNDIRTFQSGLKVSEHQMKLSEPGRFLGLSGRFPRRYSSMYSPKNHPRALLMQECPQQLQEEEKSVFRITASVQKKR